eukprot:CAMPEP_0194036180 /NCGR_PEP_ID=MMETSP0009_2-20130614/8545_1 /TAXON_ID=210454 /ORGANISM="Grammatophora oceanica, Strain CCMP 410" /LENGTH=416 /DNA_ID=CAMNT_0038677813 /DNA_START=167 /DNA_END=1417 /DNA_ORIENTATION=-
MKETGEGRKQRRSRSLPANRENVREHSDVDSRSGQEKKGADDGTNTPSNVIESAAITRTPIKRHGKLSLSTNKKMDPSNIPDLPFFVSKATKPARRLSGTVSEPTTLASLSTGDATSVHSSLAGVSTTPRAPEASAPPTPPVSIRPKLKIATSNAHKSVRNRNCVGLEISCEASDALSQITMKMDDFAFEHKATPKGSMFVPRVGDQDREGTTIQEASSVSLGTYDHEAYTCMSYGTDYDGSKTTFGMLQSNHALVHPHLQRIQPINNLITFRRDAFEATLSATTRDLFREATESASHSSISDRCEREINGESYSDVASGSSFLSEDETMADLVRRLQKDRSSSVLKFASKDREKLLCGRAHLFFRLPQVNGAKFSKEMFGEMRASQVLQLTRERPILVDIEIEEVVEGIEAFDVY